MTKRSNSVVDFDGDCINHVEVQDIKARAELKAIHKATQNFILNQELLKTERFLTRVDNKVARGIKIDKRNLWKENTLNYKKTNKLLHAERRAPLAKNMRTTRNIPIKNM